MSESNDGSNNPRRQAEALLGQLGLRSGLRGGVLTALATVIEERDGLRHANGLLTEENEACEQELRAAREDSEADVDNAGLAVTLSSQLTALVDGVLELDDSERNSNLAVVHRLDWQGFTFTVIAAAGILKLRGTEYALRPQTFQFGSDGLLTPEWLRLHGVIQACLDLKVRQRMPQHVYDTLFLGLGEDEADVEVVESPVGKGSGTTTIDTVVTNRT